MKITDDMTKLRAEVAERIGRILAVASIEVERALVRGDGCIVTVVLREGAGLSLGDLRDAATELGLVDVSATRVYSTQDGELFVRFNDVPLDWLATLAAGREPPRPR